MLNVDQVENVENADEVENGAMHHSQSVNALKLISFISFLQKFVMLFLGSFPLCAFFGHDCSCKTYLAIVNLPQQLTLRKPTGKIVFGRKFCVIGTFGGQKQDYDGKTFYHLRLVLC